MKIVYGTPLEKHLLTWAFFLGSATSILFLVWQRIILFPYLWMPLYLAVCGILAGFFPVQGLNRTRTRILIYRAMHAIFFMGAISLASSFPPPPAGGLEVSDVYLHMAEFFVLGLFSARMVHPTQTPPLRSGSILVSIAVVAAYGFLDELHQHFVPGRTPSIKDWVCDILGGSGGILVYAFFLRRFVRERS